MNGAGFPSFDDWLKECLGGGLSLTRQEVAQMHLRYTQEKLFAEEGETPDESQLHENHE